MNFKNVVAILFATFLFTPTFAQNKSNNTSIGIQLGTIEYSGDYANEMYTFTGINTSFGFTVSRYINNSFDVRGSFRYGKLDTENIFKTHLIDVNVLLDYKLNNGYILKENSIFAPYIFVGFADAVSFYTNSFTETKEAPIAYFNLPLGGGIKFNINTHLSFNIESHYNYTFTDQLDGAIAGTWDDSFLYNSLGFSYSFSTVKEG